MASIARDPNGTCRLFFTGPDGKRKKVHLGRVSDRNAETICGHVEQLVTAAKHRTLPHPDSADWANRIGPELAAKLAKAGLMLPRQIKTSTIADYCKAYREHRGDVSTGTAKGYDGAAGRLLAFFPAEQLLHTVSEADADRWLVWLKQNYAGATVSKSVKVVRQFWSQAIRDGLATLNPFAHLRTPSEVNTARSYFVDRATFARVIDACPDSQWRLLLALARYGGLRTPSEPLALTWEDLDRGRERFRVVAPKTEHQDGGERWVPLFPELVPFLDDAYDLAEPGTVHIITRWRDAEKNLRTGLLRILRRAGVKPWPRLFQNLRATRETELAEQFPLHVVAEWLGNSPKTALAHYTQVTDDHYRQAAARTAQKTAQQVPADACGISQQEDGDLPNREIRRELATIGEITEYPRQDSNL